jgi:hypothetical protein
VPGPPGGAGVDAVEQHRHGLPGLEVERLGDRRQRDPAEAGDVDVVEADDRERARNRDPAGLAGVDQGDGDVVVPDDD